MNAAPFIGYLVCVSLMIYALSWVAAKLIEMGYKRKDKPTKVKDVVCPRTGNSLTSEELFFGMCGACNRLNHTADKYCTGGIKKKDYVKG